MKLMHRCKGKQKSVISALFCAVRVENGEEVDRELWVLLEELQERNQALAAENTALRARPPTSSWPCVLSCL